MLLLTTDWPRLSLFLASDFREKNLQITILEESEQAFRLTLFCIVSVTLYDLEYSIGQLGSVTLAVLPVSFWCTCKGLQGEAAKVSIPWKWLKSSLYYQHSSPHTKPHTESKTQHYSGYKKEENQLCPSQNQHNMIDNCCFSGPLLAQLRVQSRADFEVSSELENWITFLWHQYTGTLRLTGAVFALFSTFWCLRKVFSFFLLE